VVPKAGNAQITVDAFTRKMGALQCHGCDCCPVVDSIGEWTLKTDNTSTTLTYTGALSSVMADSCPESIRTHTVVKKGKTFVQTEKGLFGPYLIRTPQGVYEPGSWNVFTDGRTSSCIAVAVFKETSAGIVGYIIGGIVGGAVLITIIIIAVVCWRRRKRNNYVPLN
jgi:hypothetical protein